MFINYELKFPNMMIGIKCESNYNSLFLFDKTIFFLINQANNNNSTMKLFRKINSTSVINL